MAYTALGTMTIDAETQWLVIASMAVALSVLLRLLSSWVERVARDRTRAITAPHLRSSATDNVDES
jgi:hypothetical protein